MRRGWICGLVCLGIGMTAARGDEFDRIEGEALVGVPQSKDAKTHTILTIRQIEGLPSVLKGLRSALIVAKTDQGNLARMLVSSGFRKPSKGQGELIPVLLLERYDTFDSADISTRLARGKELLLFDGFQLDLDTGQVVPDGQGGDIRFVAKGKDGPSLEALGKAALFTMTSAPVQATSEAARPSIGRLVIPGDFAGRFRLFSNGQWSGTLDLKVDPEGAISGRFRSDLNGTSYPINGQVSANVPQKVAFTVKYPRTQQDFDGLLWTEGKGAMAGTMTMLEHVYGFFAIREGGSVAPEGEDVGPLAKGTTRPGRKTVTIRKGQFTLDGKPRTDLELADDLKKAVAADAATWVLLQVPADEPYSAVNQAFEVVGSAGVASVRLAPLDAGP